MEKGRQETATCLHFMRIMSQTHGSKHGTRLRMDPLYSYFTLKKTQAFKSPAPLFEVYVYTSPDMTFFFQKALT